MKNRTPKYSTNLPRYGEVMSLSDFLRSCLDKTLIDYDGHGHPVKDNKMAINILVRPSRLIEIPLDCTHIIWFNK